MVTALQIDLGKVKLSLDSALDDNLHKQQEAMSAIADINEQLTQLADQQSQHQEEIAQHNTLMAQKRNEQTAKDAELAHVAGTSFEGEIRSAIADLVAQQEDTTAKVKQAQRSHDKADQDASALRDQLATQKGVLADLQAKERELSATRDGYDQRHAQAVLDECLSELAAVRAEVEKQEQALAEAKAKEQAKQQEIAQRLSEWPPLAKDFLVEYGAFAAEHPEVELLRLKARIVELAEQHADTLSERVERALNFNVPLQALARDGGRAGFLAKREDSARRYRASYGDAMAAIDGYHNSAIESFAANCHALTVMLAQAETQHKVEQAKSLLGENRHG